MSKVPSPPHGSVITHEYECSMHGRFDSGVPFGADAPPTALCPAMVKAGKPSPGYGQTRHMCRETSPWVPQVIPTIWNCPK